MDGDLSNDRSGRGEGEDAIDRLSHGTSDYLDTEFNNMQDRNFMCSIEQNSELQTKEEAFTMPQDMLSPEEFVHTVSESADAQQQYEQHIQEEPLHQQVRLHVASLPDRKPLSHSSTYMHDPQSIMSTVALKLPLQMDRDFMYRFEQNSQLQTEDEAFTKPQDMLSSEEFVHSVSETTASQKRYQQQIQEEPRCQQVPLHVSSTPGREQLSPTSTYMHDPQPLMSTVALKPPSQMDRDFMYRIEQNSQLQTEEAAFTMPQELLSLEALVRSVSESTADQQQYQENIQEEPRHQQVSLHVSSLSGRAPQSRSSTNMHEPQTLMSKVAQKAPSQMQTVGQLSTRRNPEMKNMEGIQQSELNFKKERTDLHSRMHKDDPSARPRSSTVKEPDEKTSDEARHDSVKESNISPFPQNNEPNPERMKEEEEIQKLAERMTFRRRELALTQQDVADQLNILSRKHNIFEHFRRKYVSKIENNKISPKRMLQLKPLLELWLGSTRKESHEKS